MDLLVVALAAVVPLASAVLVVVGLAEHRESVRLEAAVAPLTIEAALAINQQDWESEIRLLAGDCSPVDQFGLLPVPDEKEAP